MQDEPRCEGRRDTLFGFGFVPSELKRTARIIFIHASSYSYRLWQTFQLTRPLDRNGTLWYVSCV
jgi:hypothetical protein